MAFLAATEVAHYFLTTQDTAGTGDGITNLKIQKLCYYAQGFALVKLQKPLFFDPIQHWENGPVVPSLWQEYKYLGSSPIPTPKQPLDRTRFSAEVKAVLDQVIKVYGSFSAWELRNQTHSESPWIDTPDGAPITHQKMRAYFEPLIAHMKDSGEHSINTNDESSLAFKMASDAKFIELTELGLAELAAGRYSRLEDVRRSLRDV